MTAQDGESRRTSGSLVPADAVIVRRDLPATIDPLAALRQLRSDSHPFALIGAWAGGGAVLGSEPVAVSSPPDDLDLVFGPLTAAAGARPERSAARFGGGWVGCLGYGLAGRLHTLPPAPGGERHLADWWFGYYDHVLVYDQGTGSWTFEALVTPRRTAAIEARFAELAGRMRAAASPPVAAGRFSCGEFEVTPAPGEHRHSVARAVELIQAGDMFQANITLRLEAAFAGDPVEAFCLGAGRLRPPYAAFLRPAADQAIASFSPELFLRRTGTTVHTSPIKGTSQRSDQAVLAARQRTELTSSAKDRAENVMIVDLMRSDLSSVCRPGTVVVPRLAAAEPHPGVWHLVSDVRGELESGRTDADLVAATFPPGSVTGAPKVRAMEVIHELEVTPREVYTGAIGYRSPVGGLELSVAIRTFEFAADRVWLGAGGGIVADSDPAAEYAECLAKSRPLIEAVGGTFGTAAGPLASPRATLQVLRPRPAAGIFTSLRVSGGLPNGLAEHLARLSASAREVFGKDLPPELPGLVGKCLAGGDSGRLRITVRPLGGPLHCQVELADAGPDVDAIRLRPIELAGGLGGHKWADRRLLHRRAAEQDLAPDEHLLLIDADGSVLETDRANVFAVVDGKLRTPATDGRILPGVMRARLLAAARQAGIATAEGPLPHAELLAADEVFVTNSVLGVLPVLAAEGRADGWRPGALAGRLATAARDEHFDNQDEHGERGRPQELCLPAPRSFGAGQARAKPEVLVIDNYDSFTYNLVHLLLAADARVEVVRNDEVTAAQVAASGAAGVVISPGPCAPAEAGICVDVIRALGGRTPVLGVCLGHEAIAVAYGAQIERVAPVHGKAAVIEHDGQGIFAGLPAAFPAGRYHSLLVSQASLPACLMVSARTPDGLPMAVRHCEHPVDGLQFHPESILTIGGALLIGNFLRQVRQA
jgi:para-aminobenzoate synthetase / 4-amino-4-deoxychorismate lyase